jgi:hypothetical protein
MLLRLLLFSVFLMYACLAGSLHASDAPDVAAVNPGMEPVGASSPELGRARLALELVASGRETESPLLLLAAAELLLGIAPPVPEPEAAEEGAGSALQTLSTEALARQARALAPEDDAVEKLADRVSRRAAMAQGGMGDAVLPPSWYEAYLQPQRAYPLYLRFSGDTGAEVVVNGGTSSSLSLRAYRLSDNAVVASSPSFGSTCTVKWNPGASQTYRVEIRNNGTAGEPVVICTNGRVPE